MKRIVSIILALTLLASFGCISCFADGDSWDCTCGTKNNTSNFCPNCGSPSPVWECPSCGQENTSNFCPNCGTQKPAGGSGTSAADSSQEKKDSSSGKEFYEEGMELFEAEDYEGAITLFQKATDEGFTEAMNQLAYCYQYGFGVEQDYTKAIQVYLESSNMGNAKGQASLASIYYNFGLKEEAVEWYQKAADQGYAPAEYLLGVCYLYGDGVEQDATKAAELYSDSAEQGFPYAQCDLGVLYFEGNGIEQDFDKAVYWFEKATEEEDDLAEFYLGLCYENGYGVTSDIDKAIEWYTKAAELGNENAKNRLQELNGN